MPQRPQKSIELLGAGRQLRKRYETLHRVPPEGMRRIQGAPRRTEKRKECLGCNETQSQHIFSNKFQICEKECLCCFAELSQKQWQKEKLKTKGLAVNHKCTWIC